ncbi:MAG: hypothetical protein ACK5MN_12865 [Lachnospiraceae bacterium]
MFEQKIILFLLIILAAATVYLYIWKAKKEVEYRGDERWQEIQNRANAAANLVNYLAVILLAAGSMATEFADLKIMFTLNRVLTIGLIFFGLRNGVEVFALHYYNRKI